MKKVLLFSFLLFLIPQASFAADSSVHVSVSNNVSDSNSSVTVNSNSQGSSTTCINGKCTTTGGESHSKVCVNGKCTESDGDLDINEDNGKTQVHINNSSDKSSTISITNTPTPKITPEDESKDASEGAKKAVEKIKETRRSILDEVKNILMTFFKIWN